MENTPARTNAGYTIIEAACVNNRLEIALGRKETSLGTVFVTWQCHDGDNYFWGHYFNGDPDAARRDMLERLQAELAR